MTPKTNRKQKRREDRARRAHVRELKKRAAVVPLQVVTDLAIADANTKRLLMMAVSAAGGRLLIKTADVERVRAGSEKLQVKVTSLVDDDVEDAAAVFELVDKPDPAPAA
jgi:hypothetical protein